MSPCTLSVAPDVAPATAALFVSALSRTTAESTLTLTVSSARLVNDVPHTAAIIPTAAASA